MSEPEGRGVAWTEERGTSDEGRRRSEGGKGRRAGPRRRAGDAVSHRSDANPAPAGYRGERGKQVARACVGWFTELP